MRPAYPISRRRNKPFYVRRLVPLLWRRPSFHPVTEEVCAIMCCMSLLKIALGVGVLAFVACSSTHGSWLGEIQGRADARKDLKAGNLKVETMGPPPAPWEKTYERLLKEWYGIKFDWVAGCVVSERVIGHAKGYNEIMGKEIARKYGEDALKKTADEARKKTPTP